MTGTKKRVWLLGLVLICAISMSMLFVSASSRTDKASASATTTVDDVTFTMVDGAMVRLVSGSNGMRFIAQLSKDDLDGLTETYATVEFGMFIMPEAYLKVGDINYYNTFGGGKFDVNANYGASASIGTGAAKKYKIINMTSQAVVSPQDENVYLVRGSIGNVIDKNLALKFTACAYIKATDSESKVFYKFADTLKETRSMLEVSYRAINSGEYDDEEQKPAKDLLETYHTTYINYLVDNDIIENAEDVPTYTYTVNFVDKDSKETVHTVTSDACAMNTAIEYTPYAPSGYYIDNETTTCLDNSGKIKGVIVSSNLTYTVYVIAKPTIDITSQCIDETVGVLGAFCDKETQFIELPFDIGSLASLSNGVKIKWTDSWTQALDSQGYNAGTRRITFTSSLLTTRINNVTSGKAVYPLTIESENAIYTAKVEILGRRYALKVIETADDMSNFNTGWFDNTDNGGSAYSYYNYVIANDINGGSVSYEVSTFNLYSGTIDGRGHVIENLDLSGASYGLINYKAGNGAVIKNLALKNATGSPRNMITYYADNVTLENFYVSGTCGYTDLFETVQSGGLSATNIILNFTKLSTGAQGGLWCDGVDATVTNRINWTGNCFGTYASGLPAAWDGTGFTVENEALKFYGTTVASGTNKLRTLSSSSDINSNFNTDFFDNRTNGGVMYDYYDYLLMNDIDGGEFTYTVNENNKYGGAINGNGHILKNTVIHSVWRGMINTRVGNGAVIKDLAIVDIDNWGGNGLISYIADGVTLENVYISGSSGSNYLFGSIASGGLKLKNVILNYNNGAGAIASDLTYVTQENVIIVDSDFFTTYAGGLPAAWDDSGFTVENNILMFNGTPLMSYNNKVRTLSSSGDINSNFDTEFFDNRANGGAQYDYYNYLFTNDIEGGTITYNVNGNNNYSGVINGNGHILKDAVINSVWQGMINFRIGNGGRIKDLAIVDIYNAGGNGLISYKADGVTLENVYISGSSGSNYLFGSIDSNGLTLNKVILNYNNGAGAIASDLTYVTQNNVIIVDSNFFTTYASGLPAAWDNSGFAIEDNALKFHGKVLMKNLAPYCEDDVLGYIERQGADNQTLTLPYALGTISNFKVNGTSKSITHTSGTNTITIAKSALTDLTLANEYNCTFNCDGITYFAKLYYTDYVIRTAKDIQTKLSKTEWYDDSANGGSAYSYYNFAFANDIDCSKWSYKIEYDLGYSAYNFYSGTIDGRGHTLKDAMVGSVWFGMINRKIGNGAVIKNLAILNIHNNYNDLIASIADGLTLENVYISGDTGSGYLFSEIGSGGLTLNNVIINFNNGEGLITGDLSNVTANNVVIVDDEFTELKDSENAIEHDISWANSGFTIVDKNLMFNGNVVYDDVSVKTNAILSYTRMASSANRSSGSGNEPSGLKVTLASGDVFTYNEPIDLSGQTTNITGMETNERDNIVCFYVIPETQGIADVYDVKVRLTDVYDEDNFIEIVVYANSTDENEATGQALYAGARASVQENYAGAHYLDYSNTGMISDRIFKDVDYYTLGGYWSNLVTFAAPNGYENVRPFSFAINYSEKILYGFDQEATNTMWCTHRLADLDDSDYFDTLWDGFTTGEVYLSIYSDFYVNSSFTFVITEILGVADVGNLA
ncbi:MAG: hypothetical protein IJQ66_01770 [Clostridia bacterium]|nr:hypothetical protein [Clostridia bacterium]